LSALGIWTLNLIRAGVIESIMKKILLSVLLLFWHLQVFGAPLTIQITEGAQGALPIAVVPFGWQGKGSGPSQDIATIVRADLERSGLFKLMPVADMLARPKSGSDVDFKDWQVLRMENLVVGQIQSNGTGGYLVRFQLFDVFKREQMAGYNIPTTPNIMNTIMMTCINTYMKRLPVSGGILHPGGLYHLHWYCSG